MARHSCTDDVSNIRHYDVVIIGGGIAGIGAALTLLNAGITNIVILEAQNQPGGRILSVPINIAEDKVHSEFVEAGAQWLHGQGNQIYKIAESKNILSSIISYEGQGLCLRYDGTEIPLKLVQEVSGIVSSILEDCEKFIDQDDCVPNSVGKYLSDEFSKYLDLCQDPPSVLQDKKDLFNWHERFLVIDNSCDNLSKLSAKAWGYYKFTGGQDYLNFTHGYKALIDTLVYELPKGVLKLSLPVINIDWSKYVDDEILEKSINKPDQWNICNKEYSVVITDKNNTEYHAEHVIVTSSLGFLKANHESLFRPLLPQKLQQTINLMGYDTINKIFLIYKEPWWPDDVKGYQLIWSTDKVNCPAQLTWMYHLTGFDVLSNNKAVLVGWIGGKGAVEVESVTEDEIAQKCTKLLKSITQRYIPLPRKVVRSQWHSNSYILGGYSHTSSSCGHHIDCGPKTLSTPVCIKKPNVKNEHPVILLAGEAAHESHFSTTHGAFESGQDQADVIINYMKNTK